MQHHRGNLLYVPLATTVIKHWWVTGAAGCVADQNPGELYVVISTSQFKYGLGASGAQKSMSKHKHEHEHTQKH